MVLKTVDAWVVIQKKYIEVFDVDLAFTEINKDISEMLADNESEEKILKHINTEYRKLKIKYKLDKARKHKHVKC